MSLESRVKVARRGDAIESVETFDTNAWIERKSGGRDPSAEIVELLREPSSDGLVSLAASAQLDVQFHDGCYGAHDALIAAVVQQARPRLRSLVLDPWMLRSSVEKGALLNAFGVEYMYVAQIAVGDLGALWHTAPNLARLVIAQVRDVQLGVVSARNLDTLCLGFTETSAALTSLVDAALPRLKTLRLRVHAGDETIMHVLRNREIGALEHLSLHALKRSAEVMEALLASHHAPALESLDVRRSSDEEATWTWLAERAERLPNLALAILDSRLKNRDVAKKLPKRWKPSFVSSATRLEPR